MTVTNVRETEGGGYAATIDGVDVAFPPGGDLRKIQSWLDAGGVPTPYVAPTTEQIRDGLRAAAKARLDSKEEAALRAILIEVLDYANASRQAFNGLLQWLGSQTNLANRPALQAFRLHEATASQALDRLKDRIDAGEAD